MRFGVAFRVLAGAGVVAVVVLVSSVFMRVPPPVYFVPTTLDPIMHEVCTNPWPWAREVRAVGAGATWVRTNVLLYAPSGGRVDDVHVIGADQGVFSQTHNGLAVVGKTVQLKPGQRVVIDFNLLTGKGQPGIPVLRVTPVALGKNVIGAPSRCS